MNARHTGTELFSCDLDQAELVSGLAAEAAVVAAQMDAMCISAGGLCTTPPIAAGVAAAGAER
jgi:hypothetical protein